MSISIEGTERMYMKLGRQGFRERGKKWEMREGKINIK